MALKELFFKVIIAEKIDIPLSTAEMRLNPTFEMYLAQYHEKLVNVMYKPASDLDESVFVKLITRKLKLKFQTDKVELLEQQKKLSQE